VRRHQGHLVTDQTYTAIEVPREGVNDDTVRVVEWLAADGDKVAKGDLVVVIETTKTAVDLETPVAGYVFRLAEVGMDVPVGSAVGVVAPTAKRPTVKPVALAPATKDGQIVTAKARALLAKHGLTADPFQHLQVVRTSDVEEYISEHTRPEAGHAVRWFDGEELDPAADWDAVLESDRYRELMDLLTLLRKRMRARYNRHVGTGELLHDRWQLGREYGFGADTNVYDDCLIVGDVSLGRKCWVGPGCILDGSGGLTVGDYVDVGASSHLYTHNTIERALTGHQAPRFVKATRIGNRCFISPRSIIAPGTVIGDECFVAAGSYVEGVFPDNSYIGGNPARRLGTVEVVGGRARIKPIEAR
jgi:acetyltransferase-like isoleucine patch superfamily enzyme